MKKKYHEEDRKKIVEIEKKCEESLKDILRRASEAREISKRTEEELVYQTEKIKHIHKETDAIENNLIQTDQHLQRIKYWWKNIYSYIGLDSLTNQSNQQETVEVDKKERSTSEQKNKNNIIKESNSIKRSNTLEKKTPTNEKSFQEKYETNLGSLSSMLQELHERALLMGNAISEQNQMLENVNNKMETNITKMKDQQKMIKDIMKR